MIFISFVFVWGSFFLYVNCEINNTREIQQELFEVFKVSVFKCNDILR